MHCARLPSGDRKRRADTLASVAEEDDWPVQAYEPADGASCPWGRVPGRSPKQLLPRLPPRFTVRFSPPSSPPDGGDRVGAGCQLGGRTCFPPLRHHSAAASVTETDRKVLLDAPTSPDGLFGPQFRAMVESMKTAAEQVDGIRQHVQLAPVG